MKQKILSIIFGVLLFILLQNFFISNKAFYVDVTLENIEALAQGESGGDTLNCWHTISEDGPNALTHKTYCGNCDARLARGWSNASTCK